MFQFPGLAPLRVTGYQPGRVSPFGHLRIIACLPANRSFSQAPTSFIASGCQGIHRMPFVALIRHSNCLTLPRRAAFDGRSCIRSIEPRAPREEREIDTTSTIISMRNVKDQGPKTSSELWRRTESNRRPPACKAGALPTELRPRGVVELG